MLPSQGGMSTSGSTVSISSQRSVTGNGGRSVNRANGGPSSSLQRSNNSVKRQNAINMIEPSVTRLLVATKQLLECLTLWADGERSEKDVSDIYVNLGNEFNTTSRAFYTAGIEISDLGDVPGDLRVILEETLSRERSQAGLDLYLPAIREIVVKLLQSLKEKQAILRRSAINMPPPPPPQFANKERSPVRRSNTSSASPTSPTKTESVPSRSATVAGQGRERYVLSESYAGPAQPTTPSVQVQRAPFVRAQSPTTPPEIAENQDPPLPAPQAVPSYLAPPPTSPGWRQPDEHLTRDPLAALQRGEALERRASRRISAYQFSKLGGAAAASGEFHGRPRGSSIGSMNEGRSNLRLSTPHESDTVKEEVEPEAASETSKKDETAVEQQVSSATVPDVVVESKEQPKTTIYLELGKQVKKVVLDDPNISIAALRLLFIERFSYSPGSENFADLSIRDNKTGVKYELDESTVGDIADGSLVTLNAPDATQKNFEDELKSLLVHVVDLQTVIKSQAETIAKIVDGQAATATKLDQVSGLVEKALTAPVPPRSPSIRSPTMGSGSFRSPVERKTVDQAHLAELSSLRKELAALRQIHASLTKDVDESLAAVKEKVASAGTTTQTSIVVAGNTVVQKYHDLLSSDTDNLLTRVEDLQDVIEGLRKDVAVRGVRPLPRALDGTTKELDAARAELVRMQEYVKKEKGTWKKILEKELDNVVEEQQFFTLQEDLLADLQEDLDSATETFSLLKQFTEEQSKNPKTRVHTPAYAANTPPVDAKDAVLKEVRALNPNHESRVEAIERAEKLRQKVNESKVDEFEKELEEFVGEGKLKKSGGIEEVERVRKQREEQVWKEWSESTTLAR